MQQPSLRDSGPNRRQPSDAATPSVAHDRRISALLLLATAAIALVYVVLRIHLIGIPLDRDEGAFGYIGRRILDGGLPYRDGVDHKPPVVFYLYALALLFGRPDATGIHLFLHIYNSLTLVSVFFLVKVRFDSLSAALWAALSYAVFSASPAIQGFTASTEMLMLLPLVLSLLSAELGFRQGKPIFFLLSGIAGALAFWTKQTSITAVAFAVVCILSASLRGPRTAAMRSAVKPARALALWISGFAAVSGWIAGYFYEKNLFSEFFYWSFTHNISYALQVPSAQKGATFLAVAAGILRGDFLVLAAGLAIGLWSVFRKEVDGYYVLGLFGFSLLGLIPGYAYPHYFAQMAPAVSVAAGWGLSRLMKKLPHPETRLAATLACSACLIAVPVTVHRRYFLSSSPEQFSRDYYGRNPFVESKEVAQFLTARTKPEDTIFIFGSEPEILLYAQRRSATPFVMIYPLTSSYPRYREFQQRVWEDLERAAPRYVVMVNIPMSLMWDGKADLGILKRIDERINRDYSIEAVMMVRDFNSKMVVIIDPSAPPKEVIQNKSNIYIYRKN